MADWFAEAGAELTRAATREARRRVVRRRRRRSFAAAALVVPAVGAALLVEGGERQASAGSVLVRAVAGGHVVRLLEADAAAEDVVADLASEGLEPEPRSVATGPSRAGRVISLLVPGEAGTGDDEVFVPQGERIQVLGGRAALEGERYLAPTDALAAGEPLACAARVGDRVDVLASAVSGRADVTVTWEPAATSGSPPEGGEEGTWLASVIAWSATDVVAYTSTTPVPVSPPRGC